MPVGLVIGLVIAALGCGFGLGAWYGIASTSRRICTAWQADSVRILGAWQATLTPGKEGDRG